MEVPFYDTVILSDRYLFIQKLGSKGKFIAQFLDRLNAQWQRVTPKVARGALAYAQSRGATRIFCGHTHQTFTMSSHHASYYNAGSWTNGRPSYITVTGKEVAINVYVGRTRDSYTGEERREIAAPSFDIFEEAGLSSDVEYESVFG